MPALRFALPVVGASLLLAGSLALRQAVPTTTLSKPAAEFPEGYANLGSIRELPDGRVLVVESCDRVVKLLDFSSGAATQVGRTGAGPNEYRFPGQLLAWPGDSTIIPDPANTRYLIVNPQGQPARMFAGLANTTQTTGNSRSVTRIFLPSGSDQQGRLYSRAAGFGASPDGTLFIEDSVALERWDPRSGKLDTVGFKPNLGSGPFTPGMERPYAADFIWAAAPDGRIALLDPRDYHVEFSGGGSRLRGRPIPHTRVKLAERHKQQWREEQKPTCPTASTGTFVGVRGQPGTFRRLETEEPKTWPDDLPPFRPGAATFASDGILWVLRTTPPGDPPRYDLIDARGNVVRQVVLPARSRLLGFGRQRVYLVRIDADDLQYLQRFPLPTNERP